MEISAISNTPPQKVNQAKRNSTLTSIIGCSGIGAVINGLQSYKTQKAILKSGDEYIKQYSSEIEKIVEPRAKQEAQAFTKVLQDFIKNGKIDKKAVGLAALKGALIFAAVFTGIELISKAIENHKNKKKNAAAKQI